MNDPVASNPETRSHAKAGARPVDTGSEEGNSAQDAPVSHAKRLTERQIVTEILLRAGTAVLLLPFFIAVTHRYLHDPTRITLLVFAIGEAITLVFVLFARVPTERDWHPVSVVVSFCATYYFLAFNLAPGVHLVSEKFAAAVQIVGFLVTIVAKLSLRRSFGLLPAHRGLVTGGAYRYVRHPMYTGYFIRDLGFLLPNFGLQNLLIILLHWALQGIRIVREERLLSKDDAYRSYKRRVRYRVVWGLF
ncbi:isoprenylcysteine carboxylmethyltransferase family protein [Paraburkholderia acidicola]|uniref:Isoprenylcysteine carboxylmethyltransferase family protein n=1 Tax=Paraburkholderia acidicola TaxID=1912599 RepID=A0ABV1LVK5_9BURK